MSKNWIQKATKNMRKDKPCTGEKFGSETCPPGSKRYNLAKTFRKMAKEGHKLASLEKASVLSASDDPKDQDKAREIRVRHDYESLKKQIGSKKRPTKPAVSEAKVEKGRSDYGKATIRNWRHSGPSTVEPAMFDPENKRGKTIEKRREEHKARRGVKGAKVPTYKKEEVELDERLGGKGYKPYTSLTGKKVSGDWEDSDRGAGNKAKKRAGGKVEKKSPTYRAYVLNKEEVIDENVGAGVPLTPQELEIQKKMSKLNMRLARKRAQSMSKAKAQDAESSPEQVKEEDKAFNYVLDKLRKKHGKDAVITKTSKPKPPSEEQKKKAAAERKKRQDADNKAYAARAKKAGFKSTQDYTDVVARYGSEENYRKGKGLGT